MLEIQAIYGPNGAGKSAIIQAVDIYKNITTNYGYLYSDKNKLYLAEVINKESYQFKIEITFVVYKRENNLIQDKYRHSIKIIKRDDDFYVGEEELVRVLTRNEKCLFKTKSGEIIIDELGNNITNKMVNMLDKRSVIEIVKNDKIDIDEYLSVKEEINAFLMLTLSLEIEQFSQKKTVETNKKINSNYTYAINNEEKIKFEKYVNRLEQFIKIFNNRLITIEVEYKYNREIAIAKLYYVYDGFKVALEFECTGIKKLTRLFDFFGCKESGTILFVDDFDANINDVYLLKLLEYFIDEPNGQLVFTTHNITPMQALNDNNHSIDFITEDGQITKWKKIGNSPPANVYQRGLIEGLSFNVYPFSFVGVFQEYDE